MKEEKHSKKSKVKKEKRSQKKKSGRRNETVYDGVNYKYDKNSPGVRMNYFHFCSVLYFLV